MMATMAASPLFWAMRRGVHPFVCTTREPGVGQGMVHQSLTPYHCTAKQGERDTQYIANENACTDLGLSYTSTCVDEGPDDIGVSVLAGNKQRCGAIYLRHRSKQATHE